jgi:hypothetical protein
MHPYQQRLNGDLAVLERGDQGVSGALFGVETNGEMGMGAAPRSKGELGVGWRLEGLTRRQGTSHDNAMGVVEVTRVARCWSAQVRAVRR